MSRISVTPLVPPHVGSVVAPVAAANIADGKLLLWSAYDRYTFGGSRGYTQTAIYDPATGAISERQVASTGHDMFCPGIANMPDGRILVSGGSNNAETSIYNPSTDTWEDAPDMELGRGYQGNVTLSDGSVTVAEAVQSGRPSVLIFATPMLCRTAVCGPVLDEMKDLAAR